MAIANEKKQLGLHTSAKDEANDLGNRDIHLEDRRQKLTERNIFATVHGEGSTEASRHPFRPSAWWCGWTRIIGSSATSHILIQHLKGSIEGHAGPHALAPTAGFLK